MKTHCRIWVTDDDGELLSDCLKTSEHDDDESESAVHPCYSAVYECLKGYASNRFPEILSEIVHLAGESEMLGDETCETLGSYYRHLHGMAREAGKAIDEMSALREGRTNG